MGVNGWKNPLFEGQGGTSARMDSIQCTFYIHTVVIKPQPCEAPAPHLTHTNCGEDSFPCKYSVHMSLQC
jgi:hypothetical protein